MDLRFEKDLATGRITFSGHITEHDLANLRLDNIDRMVVVSEPENPADVLQSLEIIFRRHAQQNPSPPKA